MKITLQRHSAFSLAEVTFALALAAFCLVAIFALLPVGLKSNRSSIEQTAAASLARGIIADLRCPLNSSNQSPQYKITIPVTAGTTKSTLFIKQDTTPAGTENTDASANTDPRYRVRLIFTVPPAGQRTATMVNILITWPALADRAGGPANADPKNFSGSYEVSTALDRN